MISVKKTCSVQDLTWIWTGLSPNMPAKSLQSCLGLFAALWTILHQAPLSMGFSKWEYEVGCHTLFQPNPGIDPECLTSLALAGGFFTTSTTWESYGFNYQIWVAQLQKVIEEATDSSIPNNPCTRPLAPLYLLALELFFTVVAEVSYGEKHPPKEDKSRPHSEVVE